MTSFPYLPSYLYTTPATTSAHTTLPNTTIYDTSQHQHQLQQHQQPASSSASLHNTLQYDRSAAAPTHTPSLFTSYPSLPPRTDSATSAGSQPHLSAATAATTTHIPYLHPAHPYYTAAAQQQQQQAQAHSTI